MLSNLLAVDYTRTPPGLPNSHSAHGRDIEAEQTTADDRDGRDEVDIAEMMHCA